MPRITKVQAKPTPTPNAMDEAAEKPIVQQIMESLAPLPTKAKKAKATPPKADEPAAVSAPEATKSARKPNAWLDHVREYRGANPDVSYKQAMVNAKGTYSKPA